MLGMSERQKKSDVVFWASVVVVAVLAYPISFGPACWIAARPAPPGGVNADDYRPAMKIYHPLSAALANKGTPVVSPVLKWWIGLGVRRGYVLVLPVHSGSTQAVQIYY
jgi:hypothetical protein